MLGWAPGNSSNPPSSAGAGHDDDDPVWITTLTATTLHVDYDGDPATGTIGTADCFGGQHDADISVGALASTRIIDVSDSDMTGARIYTCDGTKIAGAWGEDPANAPSGSPGFDAGYTLIPSTTMIVDKTASVLTDANGDGKASPGDTLTYDVSIADAGSLAFTNVRRRRRHSSRARPTSPGSTVFDDGSTTTPIADSSSPSTPFPLDEGGAALPNITAGDTVFVRYRVTIDNPFLPSGTDITNIATVTADEASASDTNVVQLASADLSLTKTQTASPVHVGDDAVFHLTVSNAGPDAATGVVVTDLLPVGTTYVADTPSQGTYDDRQRRLGRRHARIGCVGDPRHHRDVERHLGDELRTDHFGERGRSRLATRRERARRLARPRPGRRRQRHGDRVAALGRSLVDQDADGITAVHG